MVDYPQVGRRPLDADGGQHMQSDRLQISVRTSWPRLGATMRPAAWKRLSRAVVERCRFDQAAAWSLGGLVALFVVGWFASASDHASHEPDQLLAMLPASSQQGERATKRLSARAAVAAPAASPAPAQPVVAPQQPSAPEPVALDPVTWAPDRFHQERNPSDHLPIAANVPTRIRVVTVRARVTAYTPYDHRDTHPEWADGVVAWHPHGKRRHVSLHRYCLATDWAQFPPGATFIHVPGYMSETYGSFPEKFRVVDDGCGAARKARKRGQQPVIDLRYMTRHSVIGSKDAWGTKYLDVEVVFPEGFEVPESIKPWVVGEEWRVYHQGKRVDGASESAASIATE